MALEKVDGNPSSEVAGAKWIKFVGMNVPGDYSVFNTDHVAFVNMDMGGGNVRYVTNFLIDGGDYGPCQSPAVTSRTTPCDSNMMFDGYDGSAGEPAYNTVTIQNATIHGFTFADPDHWECLFLSVGTSFTIQNNKFYNCNTYSIMIQEHGPLQNITIQNNWFGHTGDAGDPSTARDSSINAESPTNLLVRYNSFADGQGVTHEAGTCINCRIVGNIIGAHSNEIGCGTFSFAYNIWPDQTCGTGDVNLGASVSTLYKNGSDLASMDYHLINGTTAAASRVPNNGSDYNLSTDIDGDARTFPADAGADEFDGTDSASDTTPPTVSLTAPSAGATVSGSSATLSANASDNVGVAGVQFKVDGNNAGSEDTSAPYSTTWDSTTVSNGTHTITAVASDAAGNTTTSSSVSVTVNNTGNINIGETTITPSDDSGNANLLLAQQAILSQSATIQSLSFYVTTAAGKLRLGIYNATGPSGGPGAKVAETAEITPTTGWNTATTTIHPTLSPGTYWLAYLPSDNNLAFKKSDTSATNSRYYSFTYGTLPPTFSATPSTTPSHWSLYATLTIASTGPKPGDINNDNSVNITDLSLLLSSYNQNTTKCVTNNTYTCDLSSPSDGVVNIFDLSILLSHYGA